MEAFCFAFADTEIGGNEECAGTLRGCSGQHELIWNQEIY